MNVVYVLALTYRNETNEHISNTHTLREFSRVQGYSS